MILRILPFLIAMMLPQAAGAETLRCVLEHVINVRPDGFHEHSTKIKDSEFFVAIDNQTQKGTSSVCEKSGCATLSEITVISRSGPGAALRRLVFLWGTVELWSLEAFGNSDDYTAAAASLSGWRSQSRFGRCRVVIQ